MRQKLKIAGWVAVGALTGALTTVSLQTVARANMAPLPLEELQQLAAVFSMVKSDYVEPVDEKKLITDAISGMVSSLDPHSQYFDKKSFKEFREGTTGRFVGVGIEITQEDGLIKIVSPIEGSPAFRAGLTTGARLVAVNGQPYDAGTLRAAMAAGGPVALDAEIDGERVAVCTDKGVFAAFGMNLPGQGDKPLYQLPAQTADPDPASVSRSQIVWMDEDSFWVVVNVVVAVLWLMAVSALIVK